MARLYNLAVGLSYEPDYKAYILLTVGKNQNAKQIKNHVRKMAKYLETIKISKARLIFAIETSEYHSTSFYVVPEGAKLPSCDGCEIFEGKDIR